MLELRPDASDSSKEALPLPGAWLPVIVWCGAIFWLSSRPGSDVSAFMPPLAHGDKVVHALAFGAGGWLMRRALRLQYPTLIAWKATVFAIAFAIFYGITDELHQAFGDAGREGDVFDVIADGLGASLACTFAHWLEARRTRGARR